MRVATWPCRLYWVQISSPGKPSVNRLPFLGRAQTNATVRGPAKNVCIFVDSSFFMDSPFSLGIPEDSLWWTVSNNTSNHYYFAAGRLAPRRERLYFFSWIRSVWKVFHGDKLLLSICHVNLGSRVPQNYKHLPPRDNMCHKCTIDLKGLWIHILPASHHLGFGCVV